MFSFYGVVPGNIRIEAKKERLRGAQILQMFRFFSPFCGMSDDFAPLSLWIGLDITNSMALASRQRLLIEAELLPIYSS